MFCPKCGSRIEDTQGLCQRCRTQIIPGSIYTNSGAQQIVVVRNPRNPGVAAVLSFFYSGLGQIYNGEIAKGVLLLVLYFISLLAMFIVIGFITTPLLWLYGMFDAYKTAERLNLIGAH